MMERDCANCDYSGNSFACCCGDEDDNSSQHTHVVTVKALPERTFTESQVKAMIDQAVSKSEEKCREYKQEMLNMMNCNQSGG